MGYRIVRDKQVRYPKKGVAGVTEADGAVKIIIETHPTPVEITEDQALSLRSLLDDLTEWAEEGNNV